MKIFKNFSVSNAVIFLLLLLFVGSVFVGDSQYQNLSFTYEKTREELFYRVGLVKEQINAADYVFSVTGDKRLEENISMLKGSYHAVLPTDEYYSDILSATGEVPKIRVLVVVPSDQQYGPWRELIDSQRMGEFDYTNSLLSSRKTDPMSKLFTGFVIGHELEHARLYIDGGSVVPSSENMLKWELSAHEHTFILISKAGGERYQKLIEKSVKRYTLEITKTKEYLPFIEYDDEMKELAVIFGPSLSKYEENYRWSSFSQAVVYRYLEKTWPKDAYKNKLLYLQNFYKGIEGYEWKPN